MKVTAVTINNVLGVTEKTIAPGSVTVLRGANATAKTSILESLKAALGRGALGKLARIGAEEEPEVVLVLDDGAVRIERSATKTKVKRRIGDSAAYEDISRGQSFLDGLVDSELQNPISFLSAKPGDRVDLLLAALPVEVSWEDMPEKLGCWPSGMEVDAVSGLHPLVGLGLVREALFTERTGVNRDSKTKKASAYELKKSIPMSPAGGVEEGILEADAKLRSLRETEAGREAAREAREGTLRAEFKASAAKLRGASEEEQAAMRAACERDCHARAQECEDRVNSLRAKAEQEMSEGDAIGAAAMKDTSDRIAQESAALATLREQEKRATQDAESRRLAEKFETEAESLEGEVEKLTRGIDNLDTARRALAQDLPIEGLEVRGREVYLEGIPFSTLNTAKKIRLAVQVATLRAHDQKLPILFVDGAEALDEDHFKLLVAELEKSPCQAFLARVDEGPLTVEAS